MTCRDWEERIALHAGGDLPAADAAEVEAHLAACEDCRGVAAAYGAGIELLREAHREPLGEAHYAAVRARVLSELQRERRPAWRRIWVGGLVAVAAAAVLLLWPRPVAPARVVHPRRAVARAVVSKPEKRPMEPLVVKLLTDDPNVIIYWIAD